jgi:hypothetical protein
MIKEKRSTLTKLPQITNKNSQNSVIDGESKRPLSSNKIDDLSNKLFDELDQYDIIHKKTFNRKGKSHKKIKTNASKNMETDLK